MSLAAIISAYKEPLLLGQAVALLGDVPLALHIDLKSPVSRELERAAKTARPKSAPPIHLLPRHACRWGLIGHVLASMEGLRWFTRSGYSHVMLLTGQCAPIGPIEDVEQRVAALGDKSMIESLPFPLARWDGEGGFRRIDRYYFPVKDPRYHQPVSKRLGTRDLPYGLKPWGGSGYWCMSRPAAEYVVGYVKTHPQLLRFFATTFVPDEIFFQTILMNSPMAEEVVSTETHFMRWEGGANPLILQEGDLPDIASSGKLFARKFADPALMRACGSLEAGTDAVKM